MKKLIAITLLVSASASHAEFFTGNDLLRKHQSSSVVENMVALGYVMGVFDATRGEAHCPPDSVTSGQIKDMVIQHLEAMPTIRHFSADVQVRYVLNRAWPCAKKAGGA